MLFQFEVCSKCRYTIDEHKMVCTDVARYYYGLTNKDMEDLPGIFSSKYEEYEKGAYEKIMGLITSIPENGMVVEGDKVSLKRQVFKSFLDKIYKRSK